jgi:predicted transcriptional regulator
VRAVGRRSHPRLGELERAVMDTLWTRDESGAASDVKTVHAIVGVPRGIAPNTVQSTLERLVRKGLASRCKSGRAYTYRARVSRREWASRALDALLDAMPGADADLWLAAFVDRAERAGPEGLAELEALVRERRRRREGEER